VGETVQDPRPLPTGPIRILLAAAEPLDAQRILSDQEFRRIEEELLLGTERDRFEVRYSHATQVLDLPRTLLRFRPQIVHFSGHGGPDGLWFLNEAGHGKQVQREGLAHLFQQFSKDIECVILNACYSEPQAAEISQFIPYVVGMYEPIRSDSAIVFSRGFYQAIAAGCGVQKAFALGCVAMELEGCPGCEAPVLKRKDTL